MFITSDCWLLFSIGFDNKGANLIQIIANGDRLNHAIFNRDEIEDGMNRLISNDFVKIENDLFYTTEKAMHFYKKHKKLSEGYINEWIRFSDILNKQTFIGSADRTYHLSDEDYENAIGKYKNCFYGFFKRTK